MAEKNIFSIGYVFPGGQAQQVDFLSTRSLLDADIVVYMPTLGDKYSGLRYKGRPVISESSSFRVSEALAYWNKELLAAYNANKLVIVFLAKPIEAYVYTGMTETSGTGRNQKVTDMVDLISSYQAIPMSTLKVIPCEGTRIRHARDLKFLSSYWQAFSERSPYQVYLEGKFSHKLLYAHASERIVAAAGMNGKGGAFLFIPPLDYDYKELTQDIERDGRPVRVWKKEASALGNRLAGTMVEMSKALRSMYNVTPPPEWAKDPILLTKQERDLQKQIADKSKQIAILQNEHTNHMEELERAGSLRRLLYENGEPLEDAVREAVGLLGFTVQQIKDGEHDFDLVFSAAEGRCLGEVEGKDNSAINVDKLSQLERNVAEDFAREETAVHAKGVLFGNAQRLTAPKDRAEFFTDKCKSGAKRGHIALVRTPDLYAPAIYLKAQHDDTFATQCRKAFLEADGDLVCFPSPPMTPKDDEANGELEFLDSKHEKE